MLNRVVAAGHRKLWERIEQVVALTWPGKTIDQLLAERNVASPPPDSRDEPVVPAEAPLQRRTPRRKARTALSFERDRSIADEVKEQEQYSCQVCGRTLVNARTQEPYAESHHVHPLGHGGSDATDNMLCLCPLCHALFHLGCIGIDCLLRIHVSGVATEERLCGVAVGGQTRKADIPDEPRAIGLCDHVQHVVGDLLQTVFAEPQGPLLGLAVEVGAQ